MKKAGMHDWQTPDIDQQSSDRQRMIGEIVRAKYGFTHLEIRKAAKSADEKVAGGREADQAKWLFHVYESLEPLTFMNENDDDGGNDATEQGAGGNGRGIRLEWHLSEEELDRERLAEDKERSLEHWLAAAESLTAELSGLPTAELRVRCDAVRDSTRWFNKPAARADFTAWRPVDVLKVDEAVALSLGKSPEAVTWEQVEKILKQSAFAREFRRRRDKLQAAIDRGRIKNLTVGEFLEWAQQESLGDLHGFETVKRPKPKSVNEKSDDEIHHHTQAALYKMILGLAMYHHKYDPRAHPNDKSPPPDGGRPPNPCKEIESALANCGLSVSEKTIRKHLKAAANWAAGKGIQLK